MHRATPRNTSFRAYSAGGSRSAVHEVDDGKKMQTSKANGMKNETRENIESPQNYGFTSVVSDADKGDKGELKNGPEALMNFIGGNRSFPMTTSMDDRRHRLWDLAKDAAKGAAAMFGQKEWGQQILNTKDGQFITGNMEKKNRMQLVTNKNGKKQQKPSGGQQVAGTTQMVGEHLATRLADSRLVIRSKSGVDFEVEEFEPVVSAAAANGGGSGSSGGSSGGSGQQGNSKPTGQNTLHKEESTVYLDQNGKDTTSAHGQFFSSQRGGSDSSTYHETRKHSAQATDEHVHVRFDDNRIWVDKDGHWSEAPILQKKDKHCKE